MSRIVSVAAKYPNMHNRLHNIFVLLFLALSTPAFAVWVGVKNDMSLPIRLVSASMKSTTTGKLYPLFLGSFDAKSGVNWSYIQDSTLWEISVFAVIEDKRLLRYGLRHNDDTDQFAIADLKGDVFLFTFAEDGHVDMAKLSNLPDGELKVKEPIWNINLADNFKLPAQREIRLDRSIADEVTVLELLAGGIRKIIIPKMDVNSSVARYCYMEGYRNGWFGAVFPIIDRAALDLSVLFSGLISDDRTLLLDPKIWKILNDGYDAGRQNALLLLKKHGY